MSFVRKLIIVLVGISLGLLVTVLLLNPASILALAANLNSTSLLIRLPLTILIDVIVLAIIVVLVRSERSSNGSGLMVKAPGAIADVSIESARERILRAVSAVPDVVSAEAEVKAVRGKADVELEVVVSSASTNLPEKQKEIDRALRQVINKQLGLQIAGKPRVHIRMEGETSLASAPSLIPVPVTAPPVTETPAEAAATPEVVLVQETTMATPRYEPIVPAEQPVSLPAEAEGEEKTDNADDPRTI